jgi:hypothetical protein
MWSRVGGVLEQGPGLSGRPAAPINAGTRPLATGGHNSWLESRAWIQPVPLLGLARGPDGRGAYGCCRLVSPGRVVDEHDVPRSHQPLKGIGNCAGRPSEPPGDPGRTAGNVSRGHQLSEDQLGQFTPPETPGSGPLHLVVVRSLRQEPPAVGASSRPGPPTSRTTSPFIRFELRQLPSGPSLI